MPSDAPLGSIAAAPFKVGDKVRSKNRPSWETTIYRVAAVLGDGRIVCQNPGWKPLRVFSPDECERVPKEATEPGRLGRDDDE